MSMPPMYSFDSSGAKLYLSSVSQTVSASSSTRSFREELQEDNVSLAYDEWNFSLF